jgi:mgtE-like transporter
VVISVVGGVLSSIVVGAFTLMLSVRAHRQGWDLDSVAAPLVTAAGDAVTIPSLFLATFLVGIPWVTPFIAAIVTAIAAYATVRGLRTDLTLARRILRESILLLTLAGAVDILAGLFVQVRLDRFLAFPALLVLIPPFLEGAGALGGMLASRLASKLHLGVVTPRGLPEPVAALDASIVVLFAIVDFTLIGIAADLAAAVVGLESPGAVTVVWVSLFAGLMATVLAVVVAYYTAVATFRLGLDPDNHGIPMITSTMDLVGVLAIVIALLVFGIA